MKILSIALLSIFLHVPQTKVYICGATGAKKYHYNENCRGLNACNHQIYKVPLKEAQNYGLTLCGWED